ncbi:MAG: T9SS type A sorting domain-containing protein [Bacteroidetes bacterium]|nr:T9SS type A sorting domain-containing protein [Bacteroidota bacterium]
MKKSLLLVITTAITIISSQAQTWQWGKSGGSTDNTNANSGYIENVVDIATDPNGNSYLLAVVGKGSLNFDGHTKTGYGPMHWFIVSLSCNGTYRWSKVIGAYNPAVPTAVKTDALGGVYVFGRVSSSNSLGYAHFDADTALGFNDKRLTLLKYDTSGNYKWLRQPEADTVTAYGSNNFPLELAVDPNGTCHLLCYLTPGAFAKGNYVNTAIGTHILKYDASGNFIGNVTLPITGGTPTSYQNLRMVHSQNSGKYYLNSTSFAPGSPKLTVNGSTYSETFTAAFSGTGTFLWGKQTTANWEIYGRPALDANGKLFIAGSCRDGDSFNGYTGSGIGIFGGPVVSAMDTNGTALWTKASVTNGAAIAGAIVSKGSEIAVTGYYPSKLKWQGATDSFKQGFNNGYNVYIARLNASTGAYIKQDSLYSPATYDEAGTAITVDKNGNYYVGGYFYSQIKVAGTTLTNIGGETDFFVAKYGVSNCNCIMPVAGFSSNINPTTKVGSFTYTGTTPVDSVRWNFGDGGTSTQMNPTHTFSNGTYNVCVTVYNSCGSNQYCNNVTLSVKGLEALGNVKVYPNPANNFFTIEGAVGATATLTNNIGQRAMQFSVNTDKQVMDISSLPSGMYVLQLTDSKGNHGAMSFVKQ